MGRGSSVEQPSFFETSGLKKREEGLIPWRVGRSKGVDSSVFDCGRNQFRPLPVGSSRFQSKKGFNMEAKKIIADWREQEARAADLENQPFDLSTDEAASKEFQDVAQRMNFSSLCIEKFTAPRGGFGPLGRYIKNVLDQKSPSHEALVERELGFDGACPGYQAMDENQRKNLWVFLMMSMSHFESSCKERVYNEGPNGIASGLLQLHNENEDLYAKWDPDMNCDKGVSKNAKQSLKCGLTMLSQQVKNKGSFFYDKSHWQVLRQARKPGSEAFQIRYAMSQIKECKADAVAMDYYGSWSIKNRAPAGGSKSPIMIPPKNLSDEVAVLQAQ